MTRTAAMWVGTRLLRLRGLPLGAALAALILVLAGASALATELPLPRATAERLGAEIDRQCPDCRATGLSPCGTGEIEAGKRWLKAFFQGTPRRGYFLTFVMPHRAFFDALRTPDRGAFIVDMNVRFSEARLIAVDDRFSAVRVLPPAEIGVDYTPEHHRCFGIEKKSASCCLGDGGEDRTCLPKADSPRVHLSFRDPGVDETLDVVYAPIPGFSKLVRHRPGRDTLYFCLTDDRGVLKGR